MIGCQRADGIKPQRVAIYGLQIWDLVSDCYFAYSVISLSIKQDGSNLVLSLHFFIYLVYQD